MPPCKCHKLNRVTLKSWSLLVLNPPFIHTLAFYLQPGAGYWSVCSWLGFFEGSMYTQVHSWPKQTNMDITEGLWRMKAKSAFLLVEPTVSISCSWAERGLKWACSAGVSSVSGSRLLDPHAIGSPSSSAASPPSERATARSGRPQRAGVLRDRRRQVNKMMS